MCVYNQNDINDHLFKERDEYLQILIKIQWEYNANSNISTKQWTIPLKEVCHNFRDFLPWFLARQKISNVNNIVIWKLLGLKLEM